MRVGGVVKEATGRNSLWNNGIIETEIGWMAEEKKTKWHARTVQMKQNLLRVWRRDIRM
ncbi:hypothetical protein ACLOJK_015138 [Asimina triloba]